jgi:hypothetical protein
MHAIRVIIKIFLIADDCRSLGRIRRAKDGEFLLKRLRDKHELPVHKPISNTLASNSLGQSTVRLAHEKVQNAAPARTSFLHSPHHSHD